MLGPTGLYCVVHITDFTLLFALFCWSFDLGWLLIFLKALIISFGWWLRLVKWAEYFFDCSKKSLSLEHILLYRFTTPVEILSILFVRWHKIQSKKMTIGWFTVNWCYCKLLNFHLKGLKIQVIDWFYLHLLSYNHLYTVQNKIFLEKFCASITALSFGWIARSE